MIFFIAVDKGQTGCFWYDFFYVKHPDKNGCRANFDGKCSAKFAEIEYQLLLDSKMLEEVEMQDEEI